MKHSRVTCGDIRSVSQLLKINWNFIALQYKMYIFLDIK